MTEYQTPKEAAADIAAKPNPLDAAAAFTNECVRAEEFEFVREFLAELAQFDLRSTDRPKIEIAKSPCIPRFSVVVDGLWDCDCASDSEADTLAAARSKYPDTEILGFDHPDHYCNLQSTP